VSDTNSGCGEARLEHTGAARLVVLGSEESDRVRNDLLLLLLRELVLKAFVHGLLAALEQLDVVHNFVDQCALHSVLAQLWVCG